MSKQNSASNSPQGNSKRSESKSVPSASHMPFILPGSEPFHLKASKFRKGKEVRTKLRGIIFKAFDIGVERGRTIYAEGSGPQLHEEEKIDRILALFTKAQQELLAELKGKMPEYLPECLNYPLESGTVCNKCQACKIRHFDTNSEAGTVFDFTIKLVNAVIDKKSEDLKEVTNG